MLRRWRDGEGVVSDLIPGRSSGGRGRGHLPDEVEALIREVLRTRYLTRQRQSMTAIHRELARICRSRGWRVPSRGALARRVAIRLTRSEGTIGELARLLTDAAVVAIESGEEAVNQPTLLMAQYAGPTERRRLFERELV